MDGAHTIQTCYEVSVKTFSAVFKALSRAEVYLPGILLKPNMIVSGKHCPEQADMHRVAEMTLKCMTATVPIEVPGLVFLSGGQSELEATRNLNAINSLGKQPWALSFSFGRALQQSALHIWNGNKANIPATQAALLHRAQMSSQASLGTYSATLEAAA